MMWQNWLDPNSCLNKYILQEGILELKKEKKELEDDIKIIRAKNEQMEGIYLILFGIQQI